MTVLHRNAASGVDLKKLGRTFATFALVGALGAATALAVVNLAGSEAASPAAAQSIDYAAANALNKADIGVASAPFLAGESAQTHTGRISPSASVAITDRADLIFRQQASQAGSASGTSTVEPARVVPADRIADYPKDVSKSSSSSGSSAVSHGDWSAR